MSKSLTKRKIVIVNESQYKKLINELSPKSYGVKEFIELVKETPGLLKYLKFKTYKSLEDYLLDASYKDFHELKKEAEDFIDKKE